MAPPLENIPSWFKVLLCSLGICYLTLSLLQGWRRGVIVVGRRRGPGVDRFSRKDKPFPYWLFMCWFLGLDIILVYVAYEVITMRP
jgi:hypothetical protein